MHCVIFGGSGFIGQHFARYATTSVSGTGVLHDRSGPLADHVTLVDVEPPREGLLESLGGRGSFIEHDVRRPVPAGLLPDEVGLIGNFAAVHREPGHEPHEYYETNLPGAENVCAWAEAVGCDHILFTSSIAPYGPSEAEKDERSIPTPTTAYGGSKLVAEKIHQIWRARDPEQRKLAIVRPGVVFGPHEGGNVSRLIQSVLHRYMAYTGNRDVRKAGIYIKELCRVFDWALARNREQEPEILLNASMNPGPSVEEYIDAICEVAGVKRWIPSAPFPLLYAAGTAIELLARLVRIDQPVNRVRLNKLVRSNNIRPGYLVENGYEYQYSLIEALRDWKQDAPEEWV